MSARTKTVLRDIKKEAREFLDKDGWFLATYCRLVQDGVAGTTGHRLCLLMRDAVEQMVFRPERRELETHTESELRTLWKQLQESDDLCTPELLEPLGLWELPPMPREQLIETLRRRLVVMHMVWLADSWITQLECRPFGGWPIE